MLSHLLGRLMRCRKNQTCLPTSSSDDWLIVAMPCQRAYDRRSSASRSTNAFCNDNSFQSKDSDGSLTGYVRSPSFNRLNASTIPARSKSGASLSTVGTNQRPRQ